MCVISPQEYNKKRSLRCNYHRNWGKYTPFLQLLTKNVYSSNGFTIVRNSQTGSLFGSCLRVAAFLTFINRRREYIVHQKHLHTRVLKFPRVWGFFLAQSSFFTVNVILHTLNSTWATTTRKGQPSNNILATKPLVFILVRALKIKKIKLPAWAGNLIFWY